MKQPLKENFFFFQFAPQRRSADCSQHDFHLQKKKLFLAGWLSVELWYEICCEQGCQIFIGT
jgi:hypothetical protein